MAQSGHGWQIQPCLLLNEDLHWTAKFNHDEATRNKFWKEKKSFWMSPRTPRVTSVGQSGRCKLQVELHSSALGSRALAPSSLSIALTKRPWQEHGSLVIKDDHTLAVTQ